MDTWAGRKRVARKFVPSVCVAAAGRACHASRAVSMCCGGLRVREGDGPARDGVGDVDDGRRRVRGEGDAVDGAAGDALRAVKSSAICCCYIQAKKLLFLKVGLKLRK